MEEAELVDDRLFLRPLRLGDAAAVYEACQDPEIQRWTSVPSPYTRADAEHFVSVIGPSGWATDSSAIFGVFALADGKFLACAGLSEIVERRAIEGGRAALGYWCAPWARGTGVMTDAARLACTWAFDSLHLARIDWYAEVGNVASRRVAEKVGFTIEGVRRLLLIHRGHRRDAWAGGLLRPDLRQLGRPSGA